MSLVQKINAGLHQPLTTFKWFERFIALFCISIPVLLYITDKCRDGGHYIGFRTSISDYVYMWHSYVFGMLLSIAAMLFVFNGAVYFRVEGEKSELNLSKYGKWYNIILGLSLLMVVCLPWREYTVPHFTFATIFFFGNAVVTGLFHQKRNQALSITLAVLTVVALIIYILGPFPGFSLLAAEWISLTVVGIHFYLESR
jgi:hypothetical protein